MIAFILAAGLGTRMRPLTNDCPKPLLTVGGKPLIEWHLEKLAAAGFSKVVINSHYLAQQLEREIGNGQRWGLNIIWSREAKVLETGGGLHQALPLLCDDNKESMDTPFLLVNGDVYSDYHFSTQPPVFNASQLAHLILVNNPEHNPSGDFIFDGGSVSLASAGESSAMQTTYTYSGISWLKPSLIAEWGANTAVFPLREPLFDAVSNGQVGAELYNGIWCDVGTPARLTELDAQLRTQSSSFL